ncbi:type IV-A pilus assembly ATPase PilB [Mizugakiibacter sediminis]|uniref:General secretion pathway protein GspE n=1 Tax=Mizugakiibacter sediminis TaxID=1475481 RepID=A0A0K8QJZ7_9GAMM|nr:type IV-A pilus assembly ATPase PilB [Mizugakiibacter sediminis]GAP65031.1 type IV-A pilus assembly ATPase PilB [Mizugakiibacter sediminis]
MATQMNPTAVIGLAGIARRLVAEGVLPEADARTATEESARQKVPISVYLVEHGLVDARHVSHAASVEFGMPLFDVTSLDPAQMPVKLVSEELIQKHRALPLFKRGNRLFVGISDPTNFRALDEIKFHSNCTVEPILVEDQHLQRAIEHALTNAGPSIAGLDDAEGLENLDLGAVDEDGDSGAGGGVDASANDDAPVVKFVNKVLVDAIKRGASDIHFEPYETNYRVRFRMDGILRSVASPPIKLSTRIASRLKVMSGLDIAERRVPQDGRIKLNLSKGKAVDFRVSTCPTLFGEKIVLRILDGSAARLGIDKLGYEEDQKKLFLEAIEKPYGMVLVTGPTGSGKTVSLYTALNILNTEGRNISTVEDPVEIRLPGVNQVQQNTKRGMTFAAALRSFLRQDPDVIMVGEIRDLETAEIAIKAAQTGHMVLSTLHTNDAPQTIARLMNMGIAPYNITSSVTLVIAQRLARRLHDCKKPLNLPASALLAEGFTQQEIDAGLQIFDAVGCSGCNEGYKGRVGIYQVMPMTEEIQKIVLAGGNAIQIAEAAKRAGVRDLRGSALLKVRNGITSLAEINRVTKD